MRFRELKELISTTFRVWRLDGASRMGAALAFYLTTSVVPLVILSLVILGKVMGERAIQGQLFASLNTALGDTAARVVEDLVLEAARPGAGTGATIFGFIILGIIATNMFHHMRSSLDALWGVRGQRSPLKSFIIGRWVSVLLIVGCQLLLLMLFALGAMVSAAFPYITRWFPSQATFLTRIIYHGSVFLAVLILVAVIFHVLARVQLSWRVILVGASVTALLFLIGKLILGLCLSYSNAASLYGAFGSLLILLLWFYYIAQIFFLGAEFTKVYSEHVHGSLQPMIL